MLEFLEVRTHPAGLPIMIPMHRIVSLTPDADTGGARMVLDRGGVGGWTTVVVTSPTYADLRQLLQPINTTA